MVPLNFLLEWFLKSLIPYISKDVETSGVFTEEHAIFRAQQYSMRFMPNTPQSTLELSKWNSEPHDDGIVGSSCYL
jgi:hypothetical protein